MIRRVLVPLDGSRVSESVLGVAARVVEPEKGTLILFHAVTPAESFAMAAPEFVIREKERSEEYLQRLSRVFENKDIGVRVVVVAAEASRAIVDQSGAQEADLVVMTSHGRSGVREWPFGSVAERVLRRGSRPVLIFRGPVSRSPVRRIAVALDVTRPSLEVVPPACDLARAFGAEVELLHVGDRRPETIDQAESDFRRHHVPVRVHLAAGDPAKTILEASETLGADILALGTSAKTEDDRLFFGSVAEEVLRKASRPLLAVRARKPR